MSKITELNTNPWRTIENLAKAEGISVRAVYMRLKNDEVEKVKTPEGMRYRNCNKTEVSTSVASVEHPTPDFLDRLEDAHDRIAKLSLELGEKTGRLDEKTKLLEERTEELKRLRAENVELLKYRARYHVLQGRVGWPGEGDKN
jgi:vacuolar-type H+-ATPase subunit I/STV1